MTDWLRLSAKLFGHRYLDHTRWHARGRRLYTDKLPANFLVLGLLANALPQARFVHLVREPMEVCFSNLKELFADAYPHSYDQAEMAFRQWRCLFRQGGKQRHRAQPVLEGMQVEPGAAGDQNRFVIEHVRLAWSAAGSGRSSHACPRRRPHGHHGGQGRQPVPDRRAG